MGTAQLTRKTVIGIKQETTQGTAVAVTATDFILGEDVKLKPAIEMLKRNYYRSSLDNIASVAGQRLYELTFKTELKGSGTPGTAYTPLGAAIQACGMIETVVNGVSVTYAPTSAAASSNFFGPGKSVSIEVYLDGKKHVLAGCIGSVKIPMEVNKYVLCEFTFKGVFAVPTDTAAGTQTYLAQKPAVVNNASLSLAGLSAIATKFEVDFGNDVIIRKSVSAATGILGFMISGRNPVGSCDPEMETVASHPFLANLIAGTEAQSSIVIGATAGNIVTITLPKTQYLEVTPGDRDGILTAEVNLQFNQNAGDDWISLCMT